MLHANFQNLTSFTPSPPKHPMDYFKRGTLEYVDGPSLDENAVNPNITSEKV